MCGAGGIDRRTFFGAKGIMGCSGKPGGLKREGTDSIWSS